MSVRDETKKVAEAQAGFSKLREDYRHSTTTNLVELDSKVVDLEAKAKASTGKAKADLDASLKQIHSDRRTFDVDYKSLETATAVTWDDARAHLDTDGHCTSRPSSTRPEKNGGRVSCEGRSSFTHPPCSRARRRQTASGTSGKPNEWSGSAPCNRECSSRMTTARCDWSST